MSFAKYPSLTHSGVEWVGKVPSHWVVQPLKRQARLLTEKTDSREHPVALENIEGWTGRFLPTETEFEGDGVEFKAGDVLFGKLRPYLAKALVAESKGEAVGDFLVMRPSRAVQPRFLGYQLRSREVISIIDGSTFGSKMPRASWDFVGSMPFPIPPVEEQTVIADFLDRETAKIDALVEEQKRLIELLKEKRQAVISQAVTRGLDPNVPMKDSGVEWLGEVPAHWEVKRFGDACSSISTGPFGTALGSADYVSGGIPVINPSHIADNTVVPDEEVSVSNDTAEGLSAWILRAGDLVVARRGELGRAAVVTPESDGWICGTGSLRVTPNAERATADFLHAILQSRYAREWLNQASVGSTMANLNESILARLPVALPPAIGEQLELSRALELRLAEIAAVELSADSCVALLIERRSALISAAVTGKIDVRGHGCQAELSTTEKRQ